MSQSQSQRSVRLIKRKNSQRVSKSTSVSQSPMKKIQRSVAQNAYVLHDPVSFEPLRHLLNSYKNSELVDKLINFMNVVVQDETCRSRQSHGDSDKDRLHDILCEFTYAYVPIPIGDQLLNHGKLVNGKKRLGGGKNGNVYMSGEFETNPIVTKSPIRFTEHYLTELYINMVIINTLLLQGIQTDHLVPTYGIFVCPFQIGSEGKQICVPSKPTKHMDGNPNLLMVQKQIKGWTLYELIHSDGTNDVPELELDDILGVMKQVFTTMIWLEFSPYELYHNDLHVHNIMVQENTGNAYLIDFGFAECTIDGLRTQISKLKRVYCDNDRRLAGELRTGAYDFFILLHGLSNSPHLDVYEYFTPRFETFCSYFVTSYDIETQTYSNKIPFSIWKSRKPWLYAILYEIEELLDEEEREYVHDRNIEILSKLTNAQICLWLFEELEDWEALMNKVYDKFE